MQGYLPGQLIEWHSKRFGRCIAQRFGQIKGLKSDTAKIWANQATPDIMPDAGNRTAESANRMLKLAFRAAARMPTKNEESCFSAGFVHPIARRRKRCDWRSP